MARLRPLLVAHALAAAAIVQPGTAAAQHQAWQVDWGDHYCTLVRLGGARAPLIVGARIVPGSDKMSLIVVSGRESAPTGVSTVALGPSGRRFAVRSQMERRPGGRRALELHELPDEFIGLLGEADEIRLEGEGRVKRRIGLVGAGPAVAALRQCISEALREWEIDEAALDALRERPVPTNMFGLRYEDYPEDALRRRSQGRVAVRIDVTADGRASACAPVGSSGDRSLDITTCRVILERARFTPAISAEGRPVAVRISGLVTWRIGG